MPEIVFLPNRAGNPEDPEFRLYDFLCDCREGRTDGWTCKKTAAKGDLYLFWFGKPAMKIGGIGICQGDMREENNEGADWTESVFANTRSL